jgi:hypothetical protein
LSFIKLNSGGDPDISRLEAIAPVDPDLLACVQENLRALIRCRSQRIDLVYLVAEHLHGRTRKLV